ncbi:MAG TPA: phosphoribosylformylglycinamidine synthase [Moheibacter sp.]|nr:phosphoribosylformylglycinamidine synthase [Moheibacter sp.]
MNKRIFIQKKSNFDILSKNVTQELQNLAAGTKCKVFVVYDLFNIDEKQLKDSLFKVFADPVTDQAFLDLNEVLTQSSEEKYFASEPIPGQYDQRADSANQCLQLMGIHNTEVKTAYLYVFEDISVDLFQKAKDYLINPIESREKNLNQLEVHETPEIKPVQTMDGFIDFDEVQLNELHQNFGFSMGMDDLQFIQTHFQSIQRNPTETELKVLDTYWSDHCRHTTFETEITAVKFENDFQETLQKTFDYYLSIRQELNITKPIRMMDMATIMGKYLSKTGKITNIDISEEINACSIVVPIDVDGVEEEWLLQFKNETHNHPTEVEPYGGASTCVGGAIRDPLSGRAYVFQAMRVTGSANPLEKIETTLTGKLPQRKITKEAAKGYSSYGNQIGLASTHVREIYDEGYKAKRMEVGFVAGAVKRDWVRREEPTAGDKVILLGGLTGRDGVGGATGSSKTHDGQNLEELSAEVQRGNAIVERKIQRLFRSQAVLALIKKCNDFGAGGVSVAIGEIARGVNINLDTLPLKYAGLNGTEIALSESQERMAVVVDNKDVDQFIALAQVENLEATVVAEVTSDETMTMWWKGDKIVELDRRFLDSNGVRKQTTVQVKNGENTDPFAPRMFNKESFVHLLTELNHASQKGMIDLFDDHVGRGTVLKSFGGKTQNTPEDISVQKFPTDGFTNAVSMASFGFNPLISRWSPYHGAYFAVMESVAKIVAAGGKYQDIRLTFQEYFESLKNDPSRWGKPFAALLGSVEAQKQLEIPAIGGKDSMSGSYQDLDVPPTLISFAVSPNKTDAIISATLQSKNSKLSIFIPNTTDDFLLDEMNLKAIFDAIHSNNNKILSAVSAKFGGISETLALMSFGNEIGFTVETSLELMQYFPAAIVVEHQEDLTLPQTIQNNFHHLGQTNASKEISFNGISMEIDAIVKEWKSTFAELFPENTAQSMTKKFDLAIETSDDIQAPVYLSTKLASPKVFIPVFPGTNSEYDSEKAFRKEGAQTEIGVFRNLTPKDIEETVIAFAKAIDQAQILFIPGGFSAADEPDGSGKFIATVLRNERIKDSVYALLERNGLILGICNGFQGLIKSGLLPYGEIQELAEDTPTLTANEIGRHVSQIVKVRVNASHSPWLHNLAGQEFLVPVSHGEGRFVADEKNLKKLIQQNQIATQYVDFKGNVASEMPFNPNGSVMGIEGIVSPCGKVYGRMGHPERIEKGVFTNIPDMEIMPIFKNGVDYFK